MSRSDKLEQVKQKFEEIHANPPKSLEEALKEYEFPVLKLDKNADLEPLGLGTTSLKDPDFDQE